MLKLGCVNMFLSSCVIVFTIDNGYLRSKFDTVQGYLSSLTCMCIVVKNDMNTLCIVLLLSTLVVPPPCITSMLFKMKRQGLRAPLACVYACLCSTKRTSSDVSIIVSTAGSFSRIISQISM